MWEQLAGAGLQLVGGILGRRSQQRYEQKMYERQKKDNSFVERRKDAEAAGLNPFLALSGRAGVSQFGGFSTGAYGAAPLSPVGDALVGLGNMVASYNPVAEKRAQSESDLRILLMKKQLNAIEKSPRRSHSFHQPKIDQKYTGKPYKGAWEVGKVEVTNPHPTADVNPHLSDAEAWETRYGDWFQELAGIRNAVGDLLYNGYKYGPAGAANVRPSVRRAAKPIWASIKTQPPSFHTPHPRSQR